MIDLFSAPKLDDCISIFGFGFIDVAMHSDGGHDRIRPKLVFFVVLPMLEELRCVLVAALLPLSFLFPT